MIEGRLTGIVEGAITGWVTAPEPAYLEAAAEGEDAFGRTRAEAGEDGRAHFSIPIPEAYRDGRMRFFDVRPLGETRPLDGGPVAFDGGLFAALALASAAEPTAPPTEPPPLVDGQVRFDWPDRMRGWAWAPDAPERRLRIEILAGEAVVATVAADRPDPEARGDGRHGFQVDLSRLLRYGPHDITVRPAGAAEALPGGRFRTGAFAADGEVDCPGYLDLPRDRALLERLPFEQQAHAAPRVDPARLVPRLINRLRRERMGFAATGPQILLLRLPQAGEDAGRVWGLQSYPATALLDAAAGEAAIRAASLDAGLVTFVAPGDLLHPSASGILARIEAADAVSWPRFCAEAAKAGSAGWLLRRPPTDVVTVAHGAVSDTTLAVRGALLAETPGPVLAALGEGRMHPLWVWLATRPLAWRQHPEALSSRVGDWAPPARAELERDEALCRDLLAGEPVTFARTAGELPMPQVMVPTRRAAKTSVLVPFRGGAELTLRCIHALAGQRLSGELELVLVDNQSPPEEAERILDGARRMLGPGRVVALRYDAPFSHSAQNNLAARAASGEVLAICNNDVVLQDPALLEQLGAWALRPGICAVGCRLEDPARGRGSYGHVFQAPTGNPFLPPLRENPDPAYGRHVHAAPGATLALAAISRDTFLGLGGLDEARFPIGYNDIDFMLRASRQGLTHLYLGHVWAEHRRGSSRTGDDEDLQALLINQAYPEAAQGHLAQLARVWVGPSPKTAAAAAAQPSPEDAALIERLEGLMARHAAGEQQRADLAQAFARAQQLVSKLEVELDEARALGDAKV